MKKLLSVLVILLLVAGCGQKEIKSLSDELLFDNRIVLGVSPDYPPFQSLNNKGEVIGFERDMMEELVKIINRNNNLTLTTEYKQMSFEMIISAIHTRQVDVGMSGFTYSEDRDAIFSHPFFDSEQIAIVKEDSPITKLSELENKRIGVGLGTTGEEAVNKIPGVKVTTSEYPIMFSALQNGSLDVIVSDLIVGNNYIEEYGFRRLEESIASEEMMLLFREDLIFLEDETNKAIDEFIKTEKYMELREKWGLQ